MQFDLYKLCDNDSTIRVIWNKRLRNELIKSLIKLKSNGIKYKDIANSSKIDYTSLRRYFKKPSIPLRLFKSLKDNYNIDLSKYFLYLENTNLRRKVKIIRNLNLDLAKVLGAHVADGNLRARFGLRHNRKSIHYELIIREEFKSNALAFCKWFNRLFNFGIKPIKRKNHYEIYISNKIIYNYFTRILNIPSGRKTDIIKIPNIILNSNINIKKAFLHGLFMFDGGVDYKTCAIGLVSKSKSLIRQTNNLLKEIKITPDYLKLEPDKYGRYRLEIYDLNKIKKCFFLFEKKTEKWYRLKEHFYGFDEVKKIKTKNNINITIKKLDKYYPRKRINATTFSDVLRLFKQNKELTSKNISQLIERGYTTVNSYLLKLNKWRIVNKEKKGLNTIWKLNPTLSNINIHRRY